MIQLPRESAALALRLAAAQRVPVEAAIRRALENEARVAGLAPAAAPRRRMTAERMRTFATEFAALPVRDPRSPDEIADDLNAT